MNDFDFMGFSYDGGSSEMSMCAYLNDLEDENEKLRAELEQMATCVYYKQDGLCRYGGDDLANVCVLGPCPHNRSAQEVLTELEQVKRAAKNDIPHNCHTCIYRTDPMCPGNKLKNSFGFQENCKKWEWRGLEKED